MRDRRGLSLLETLLAVGILAVAVLSIVLVFTFSMKLLRQSNQVTGATDVAREFLESVRAGGHGLITPGNYDGRLSIPTPPDPVTGFPPSPYPQGVRNGEAYTLVVQADSTGMPPNTLAVTVDVYWNAQSKVTLQTYIRP